MKRSSEMELTEGVMSRNGRRDEEDEEVKQGGEEGHDGWWVFERWREIQRWRRG